MKNLAPIAPPYGPYVRVQRADSGWRVEGQAHFACGRGAAIRSEIGGASAAGWSWDGTTLQVRNDRYGLVPLYYVDQGGEISVSTSIPQLLSLGISAAFDYEAIAVFMRLGSYLGCDTAFQTVRALPPNASLRWSAGRGELTDTIFAVPTENRIGRKAALDDFIELFRQSIRRSAPSESAFAVPLSGGRDSRHILLELCAQGHRPKVCVTARYFPPGYAGEADVEVAARIAHAVGVTHCIVDPPSSRYEAERRSYVQSSFCSMDSAWLLPVADVLRGQVDRIYDGMGGDVLSAGLFLTAEKLRLFRSGQLRELAEVMLEGAGEAPIFAAPVRRRLQRSVAVDRCARELERHVGAPNPVGSFIFWNRTRRHIAAHTYSILGRAGSVLTPYLDDDLFDFLTGLPAEMFLDHSFHTEAISLAYPRFADQPYAFPPRAVYRAGDQPAVRKFASDAMMGALRFGRTGLVRRRYFLPRLLRCMVEQREAASINWLGPSLLYLLEVERAAGAGAQVSA